MKQVLTQTNKFHCNTVMLCERFLKNRLSAGLNADISDRNLMFILMYNLIFLF